MDDTALRRAPRSAEYDAKTQQLIDAGLELVFRDLDDAAGRPNGILKFRWPSRDRVMRRYRIRSGDESATHGLFATRWPTMDTFYADMFRSALGAAGYAGHEDIASSLAPTMLGSVDMRDAATMVALENMKVFLDSPMFRMKLLATATDPSGPVFGPVLAEFYEAATLWWSAAYAQMMAAAGVRLKADVPMRQFAVWMTALIEGLSCRFVARPADFGGDLRGAAASLVQAGFALFLGATTPATDDVDGPDRPGSGPLVGDGFLALFAAPDGA